MAREGWPGEKFLIKIWDSLVDKGVAGWLRPLQIKREEAARTQALRHSALVFEQTRREISDIRAGRKAFVRGRLVSIVPGQLADDHGRPEE